MLNTLLCGILKSNFVLLFIFQFPISKSHLDYDEDANEDFNDSEESVFSGLEDSGSDDESNDDSDVESADRYTKDNNTEKSEMEKESSSKVMTNSQVSHGTGLSCKVN